MFGTPLRVRGFSSDNHSVLVVGEYSLCPEIKEDGSYGKDTEFYLSKEFLTPGILTVNGFQLFQNVYTVRNVLGGYRQPCIIPAGTKVFIDVFYKDNPSMVWILVAEGENIDCYDANDVPVEALSTQPLQSPDFWLAEKNAKKEVKLEKSNKINQKGSLGDFLSHVFSRRFPRFSVPIIKL